MKLSTPLLFGVITLTAACAGVLGIRPAGRRPFEHRAHVLKGIECTKCHVGIATAGEDGPLHIPSSADCRSCHSKPHNEGSCGDCHGLTSTRAAAARAREDLRFTHEAHLQRTKGQCVRCHADVAVGGDVLRPRMALCGSCHPHREELAQGLQEGCARCHVDVQSEGRKPDDHLIHAADFAREHGVRAAANSQVCASCHAESFCASCHGKTTPRLRERLHFDDPMGAGVHRAGFRARHAEEARNDPGLCTTCHSPNVCSDCHAAEKVSVEGGGRSPHKAGWLGLPGAPNEHGRASWREPELCASCHGGAGEALCVGCHKVGAMGGNPHSPSFSSRRDPETERPCLMCHGRGI